jgi:PAS domain S-box-containing protein
VSRASNIQLRQLALACLIGAALALLLLTVAGIGGWQRARQGLQEAQRIGALHGDMERLRLAVDYLTLLQPDPAVARGVAGDAERIGRTLAPIDHPTARVAAAHLREITHITAEIAEGRLPPGTSAQPRSPAPQNIARELHTHISVVSDGLHELSTGMQQQALATLRWLLLGLITLVVTLALLSLFAFALIHRRLVGPIRAIETGLDQFATGRLDARIAVQRDDELGRLAQAFNHMAERRELQENRLSESEQRLRLFATATTGSVFDVDLVNRTAWRDERFQQLTGYAADSVEATFDGWTSIAHPADQRRILDNLEAAISSGATYWEVRNRMRHADGRWHYMVSHALLVRDEHGQVVRMVGGTSDITDRLAMEERQNQGQRLEAIGQLTGGVAHDFNNLLTVILGTAELLGEKMDDDPDRRMLAGMIVNAAQRGASLTRHLLAFARKQALEPCVIDVNQLLAELEPLLRRTLGEHVELELTRGAGLWPALVDPAQLESAVLNLCLNARDAMPAGGRLTLETANTHLDQNYADANVEVRPGQYVLLAVSDTGVGIPPEQLVRVFEPFFTTKDKGKGTGLGLSMVFGFVKQSGGHIKLYSEPGQGTTVRMYLPRATGQAQAGALPPREVAIPRGAGEVILVVEDEPAVLHHAIEQLTLLGYQPIAANGGEAALAFLRERDDIVLLFTDIVMPGMNGRELADAARLLRPNLRVLYSSGYTENAVVHHGRLDPGVRLLAKPYRRADLARRVYEALHQ